MFNYFVQQYTRLKQRVSQIQMHPSRAVIFMATFASVFVIGMLISADVVGAAGFAEATFSALAAFFAKIIFGFAKFMIGLTLFFLKMFIALAIYNDFKDAVVVQVGWALVRDVANMFFIVAMLVIAFATILGVESYNMKKTMGKLLLMAILVNFSNLIAQLIIDVAHVFSMTFINAISATAGGNVINMLNLADIQTLQAPDQPQGDLGFQLLTTSIFASAFASVAFFTLGVYLSVMVWRTVMLWILMVLSPLAFAFGALPATKKYATDWWKQFSDNVLSLPVMVFFMWLAFATLGEGSVLSSVLGVDINAVSGDSMQYLSTSGAASNGGGQATLSQASTWNNLGGFVVIIGFLWAGLDQVQKLGVKGGNGAVRNWLGKVATIGSGAFLGIMAAKGIGAVGEAVGENIGDRAKLLKWRVGQNKFGKHIPFMGTGVFAQAKIRRKQRLKNIEQAEKDRDIEIAKSAATGGLFGGPSKDERAKYAFAASLAEQKSKKEMDYLEGKLKQDKFKEEKEAYEVNEAAILASGQVNGKALSADSMNALSPDEQLAVRDAAVKGLGVMSIELQELKNQDLQERMTAELDEAISLLRMNQQKSEFKKLTDRVADVDAELAAEARAGVTDADIAASKAEIEANIRGNISEADVTQAVAAMEAEIRGNISEADVTQAVAAMEAEIRAGVTDEDVEASVRAQAIKDARAQYSSTFLEGNNLERFIGNRFVTDDDIEETRIQMRDSHAASLISKGWEEEKAKETAEAISQRRNDIRQYAAESLGKEIVEESSDEELTALVNDIYESENFGSKEADSAVKDVDLVSSVRKKLEQQALDNAGDLHATARKNIGDNAVANTDITSMARKQVEDSALGRVDIQAQAKKLAEDMAVQKTFAEDRTDLYFEKGVYEGLERLGALDATQLAKMKSGKVKAQVDEMSAYIMDLRREHIGKRGDELRIKHGGKIRENLTEFEHFSLDEHLAELGNNYDFIARAKKDLASGKLDEEQKRKTIEQLKNRVQQQVQLISSSLNKGYGAFIGKVLAARDASYENLELNDEANIHKIILGLTNAVDRQTMEGQGAAEQESLRRTLGSDKQEILLRTLMMGLQRAQEKGQHQFHAQMLVGKDHAGKEQVGFSHLMGAGLGTSREEGGIPRLGTGKAKSGRDIADSKRHGEILPTYTYDSSDDGRSFARTMVKNGTEVALGIRDDLTDIVIDGLISATPQQIRRESTAKNNLISGGTYDESSWKKSNNDGSEGQFVVATQKVEEDLKKMSKGFQDRLRTAGTNRQAKDRILDTMRERYKQFGVNTTGMTQDQLVALGTKIRVDSNLLG